MADAESDALSIRDARDLHGGGAVGGGLVTELAVVVPAPALHRAVRQWWCCRWRC